MPVEFEPVDEAEAPAAGVEFEPVDESGAPAAGPPAGGVEFEETPSVELPATGQKVHAPWGTTMRNIIGGTSDTIADILTGTGRQLGQNYDQFNRFGRSDQLPPLKPFDPNEPTYLSLLADKIRRGNKLVFPVKELPPGVSKTEKFFTETVPHGAGSTIGFLVGGAVGRGAGMGETMGVALTGAAAQAEQGFREAKDAGADDETAWTSFFINAGLGMSEAIPVAKWLSRADGSHALRHALIDGVEELAQEGFQNISGNITAQKLYDPDRPWNQGTGEATGAGFTIGTAFSLIASAVAHVARGRPRRPARNYYGPRPPPRTTTTVSPPAGAAGPTVDADLVFYPEQAQLPAPGETGTGVGFEAVGDMEVGGDEGAAPEAPATTPPAPGPVAPTEGGEAAPALPVGTRVEMTPVGPTVDVEPAGPGSVLPTTTPAVRTPDAPAEGAPGQPGTADNPPTPEPSNVLDEQLRLTLDLTTSKAVTLVTPGEVMPPVPDGLEQVVTPHGVAIYNPFKIDREGVIYAGQEKVFDPKLLGLGGTTETAAPSTIVLTTTSPGVPDVLAQTVDIDPAAIEDATKAQGEAAPGGTQVIKTPEEVEAERRRGVKRDEIEAAKEKARLELAAQTQAAETERYKAEREAQLAVPETKPAWQMTLAEFTESPMAMSVPDIHGGIFSKTLEEMRTAVDDPELPLNVLQSLATIIGAPKKTGTKSEVRESIRETARIKFLLRPYKDNPDLLEAAFTLEQLKTMGKFADVWLGGNKQQLAIQLLNWDTKSRHEGRSALIRVNYWKQVMKALRARLDVSREVQKQADAYIEDLDAEEFEQKEPGYSVKYARRVEHDDFKTGLKKGPAYFWIGNEDGRLAKIFIDGVISDVAEKATDADREMLQRTASRIVGVEVETPEGVKAPPSTAVTPTPVPTVAPAAAAPAVTVENFHKQNLARFSGVMRTMVEKARVIRDIEPKRRKAAESKFWSEYQRFIPAYLAVQHLFPKNALEPFMGKYKEDFDGFELRKDYSTQDLTLLKDAFNKLVAMDKSLPVPAELASGTLGRLIYAKRLPEPGTEANVIAQSRAILKRMAGMELVVKAQAAKRDYDLEYHGTNAERDALNKLANDLSAKLATPDQPIVRFDGTRFVRAVKYGDRELVEKLGAPIPPVAKPGTSEQPPGGPTDEPGTGPRPGTPSPPAGGSPGTEGPAVGGTLPVDVRTPTGVSPNAPQEQGPGGVPGSQAAAGPGPDLEAEGGGDVGEGGDRGGGAGGVGPAAGTPGGRPREETAVPERGPDDPALPGGSATPVVAPPAVPLPQPLVESEQNNVLPQDKDWVPAGAKTRVRANLEAIRLLKVLESEGRNPTKAEKETLSEYTGWGMFPQVFDLAKRRLVEQGDRYYVGHTDFDAAQKWEKEWGPLYDQVLAAMTRDEYVAARDSTLNAHYTSRTVINGIWAAIERLGFRGGRALEPSAGIGHFIGLTPETTRTGTTWDAVELDNLTGRILTKLYPQARVQQTGFQDAKLKSNHYDLVVSNVPFDKQGPSDKRYPPLSLHNYFFVRGIDLVKPGGLMVFITSDSTMDVDRSQKARDLLRDRADLVQAIRLPNNAFKGNAGTEVTTDILILRKRDGSPFKGADWNRTEEAKTYKGEPLKVNEYYVAHPENLLGKLSLEGTMYGGKGQAALLPIEGANLAYQMQQAVDRLPSNIIGSQSLPDERIDLTAQPEQAGNVKMGLLVLRNNKLVQNIDGQLVPAKWIPKGKETQAKRYVAVRDKAQAHINLQRDPNATDEDIAKSMGELNQLYDEYVKAHGPFNLRSSSFLKGDTDFTLATALEDQKTKIVPVPGGKAKKVVTYHKTAMFSKRTVFPRTAPGKADSVQDAIPISANFKGRIDPEYVGQLLGISPGEARDQLLASGLVFEDPVTGAIEEPTQYLSGFVKEKLAQARLRAADNPEYARNVEALEKVQPRDLTIEEVKPSLGARWIAPTVFEQFLQEKLGVHSKINLTEQTGDWSIAASVGAGEALNKTTWGSGGYTGSELVQLAMNLKRPVVMKPDMNSDRDDAMTLDREATELAAEKQNELKELFVEWVRSKPEIGAEVAAAYNEKLNVSIPGTWKGPSWTYYPDASHDIILYTHQKNVITRILQESTILAHAVGTGKTYIMGTAAMEMRRLGLAKKPMIAVLNSTTEQFAAKIRHLYPAARILAPGEREREADQRNRTMSRIATGDWDLVIVPHSFMDLLPDDPMRVKGYMDMRVQELEEALAAAGGKDNDKNVKVKDLVKALRNLRKKIADLQARKLDNVLTFEQLGVDALFVDEAHEYKKLEFDTKMDRIKGLDNDFSKQGLAMLMKVRWVQEHNQGRNVVFATGTPISNTLAEAWNIIRYVRPDILEKYNVKDFDSWAATFGDTVVKPEMTAGGTFKPVERFARFKNGHELLQMWRAAADVVTAKDVNLPGVPVLKGGKKDPILIKPTPVLKAFIRRIQDTLDAFQAMSGRDKWLNRSIPVVAYTMARKASLDMRMVDPTQPDSPANKLSEVAKQIIRIYHESMATKGTQVAFADLFRDDPKNEKFNAFKELKRKLMAGGIPEHEIVIVDDKMKGPKRELTWAAVNAGEVRVIMGTTARVGTGVNIQERLIALHHMDAPLRPMDIEQREGRILRQLNSNPVVEILPYGVEGTLDAALYGLLSTKNIFIDQLMSGDMSDREFEDAFSETTMTFQQMMGAFSGNPLAMEKVALEHQIQRLEAGEAADSRKRTDAQRQLANLKSGGMEISKSDAARTAAKANRLNAAWAGPSAEWEWEVEGTKSKGPEGTKAVTAYFNREISKAKVATQGRKYRASPVLRIADITVNGLPIHAGVIVWVDHTKEGFPSTSENMQPEVKWWVEGDDPDYAARVTTGAGLINSVRAAAERSTEIAREAALAVEAAARNVLQLTEFLKHPWDKTAELETARSRLMEIHRLIAIQDAEAEAERKRDRLAAAKKRIPGVVKDVEVHVGIDENGQTVYHFGRSPNPRPLSVRREQIRRLLAQLTATKEAYDAWNKQGLDAREEDKPQGNHPTWIKPLEDELGKIEAEMVAQARQRAQAAQPDLPPARDRRYGMSLIPGLGPGPSDEEGRRQFMDQIAEDPTISELAKGKIANQLYARRGNQSDIDTAVRIVEEAGGPEQAINVWRNPSNDMPDVIRMAVGMVIIKQLAARQLTAASAKQEAESDRLATLQASFIDEFAEVTTNVAQALQILRAFGFMTPEGFIQYYKREVKKVRREVKQDIGDDVDTARQGFADADKEGVADLETDKQAQKATTDAVNEAIAQSPEIQELVRVLSQDIVAQTTEGRRQVVARVRELISPKAKDWWDRQGRSLWQQYRDSAVAKLLRLPGTASERAHIDTLTRQLVATLRAQIMQAMETVGRPAQLGGPAPRSPAVMILEALSNRERYSDVWDRVTNLFLEQNPNDDLALQMASEPASIISPALVQAVIKEEMKMAETGLGEIVRYHYQHAGDGKVLSDRIQDRLGVTGADARMIADMIDREYKAMVAEKTASIATRIANARKRESRLIRLARGELVDTEKLPADELDRAITKKLREIRLRLGTIIRASWLNQGRTANAVVSQLVNEAHLPQHTAVRLLAQLQTRFAALVADRKARVIDSIMKRVARKYRRREMWERLAEASNVGALSNEQAWNALAPSLKLPTYSIQVAQEVNALAQKLQATPEGFQRNRVIRDLLDTIKRANGISSMSLIVSLWYARLLSGPTTHILNTMSNVQQVSAALVFAAGRRPQDAPFLLNALWTGLIKGLPEAHEVMTTGRITGVRLLKAEPAGALELAPNQHIWRFLKHWRLVTRALAAEDILMFYPAREMRMVQLARELARQSGAATKDEVTAEAEKILNRGSAAITAAEAQATAEGLTGLDWKRRVNELVDAGMDQGLVENARDYALRVTYNSKPYGFLGTVAQFIRPILGRYPMLRLVDPFVNVVANVANEAISYTPGANIPKLIDAAWRGRVHGEQAGFNDIYELYGKAAAGLLISALFAALAAAFLWDDDPWFAISGSGPPDTVKKNQLMATGWRPYSIKIGNRWYNYSETPLGVALASVGTYLDAVKYQRLEEKGVLSNIAYAVRGMVASILDRSFLVGFADLLAAIQEKGVKREQAIVKALSRPLGTIVSSRLTAQIDRMLDPTVYESTTTEGALVSQIPVVRRLGQPALNALGDPVKSSPIERFISSTHKDPVFDMLAARDAWIPMQTPRELGGVMKDFTDDETHRFYQLRGPPLRQALTQLLPALKICTPAAARAIVSKVVAAYTQNAKLIIIADRIKREREARQQK